MPRASPESRVSSSAQNTGSPSICGKQPQTTDAIASTSNAMRPLPISAKSSVAPTCAAAGVIALWPCGSTASPPVMRAAPGHAKVRAVLAQGSARSCVRYQNGLGGVEGHRHLIAVGDGDGNAGRRGEQLGDRVRKAESVFHVIPEIRALPDPAGERVGHVDILRDAHRMRSHRQRSRSGGNSVMADVDPHRPDLYGNKLAVSFKAGHVEHVGVTHEVGDEAAVGLVVEPVSYTH